MTVFRKIGRTVTLVVFLVFGSALYPTPLSTRFSPFAPASAVLTLSSVCSNGSSGSELVLETTPTPGSGALLFDCGTNPNGGQPIPAFSISSSTTATPTFAILAPSGSIISLALDPVIGVGLRGSCSGSIIGLTNGIPVTLTSSNAFDYCLTYSGFPNSGGSIPPFTVTWTSSISTQSVECGHDLSCSVQSNATLSNIKFAGNTIHVEAEGPHGALGYAKVTVPISSIPHIGELHVFVDNSNLPSSAVTITSNSTDYFIFFVFTFHSPVMIDIQLTSPEQIPNAPTILGLVPAFFYVVVGTMIAVIVTVSAAVALRRRERASRMSSQSFRARRDSSR